MLFDHSNDPLELKNLSSDPTHPKTVKALKQVLQQLP